MPVSFASRALNHVEHSYSVTEREFLSVTFGQKWFFHTALGYKVHAITDHKFISDLFKEQTFTNNQKFNCYFMTVLEFATSFRYLPCKFNIPSLMVYQAFLKMKNFVKLMLLLLYK